MNVAVNTGSGNHYKHANRHVDDNEAVCPLNCPGRQVPADARDELFRAVTAKDYARAWIPPPRPPLAQSMGDSLPPLFVVFVPDPVLIQHAHQLTSDGPGFLHITVVDEDVDVVRMLQQDAPGAVEENVPEGLETDGVTGKSETSMKVAYWEWVSPINSSTCFRR